MIEGQWSTRFAPVAHELERQLRGARGTGAAVAIYHRGQAVFDGFGGARNAHGEPWNADTMVMAFSTGKGCAALLMHLLVDAGLASYEDRVVDHWPEFASGPAARVKQTITLRHVLSHRAGLFRLADMIDDLWAVLDFEAMVERLEQAVPAHVPGAASGYHGISYSWLLGELLQRIGGKRIDPLMRERLIEPLGLDGAYFGLPEHELTRCAELASAYEPITLGHHALSLAHPLVRTLSLGRVQLDDLRAALVLPVSKRLSWNDPRLRRACVLSSTGVFTARSLARMYAVLASGGVLDGQTVLSAATLGAIQRVQSHELDRVMRIAPHWRLGYHGIQVGGRFVPNAFGHCGYRGSGAFADPSRQLAFAYVHNAKAGAHPMGGSRFQRLARVALSCADGTAGARLAGG